MDTATASVTARAPKIGLALSGGGFRASLFHLGVIRRLEELGIMKDVAVVSSVSGGSIIAAYYLVEMERRLRKLKTEERDNANKRVEIFEEIAHDFIAALDHNLRIRALIFTPFHHPILFLKTVFLAAFRAGARSELIQAEYDKWFYGGDTLDQLPSVTRDGYASNMAGPRLVLNATSLLTGEGVMFSREPNTNLEDLQTPDRNFIRLSKVVAASSGVPVVFPPTPIRGDLLVDGGVSDNQGIEALTNHPENKCDVLIVSDASGQMEAIDTMGTDEAAVYLRVSDIFQFQIREKLLTSLAQMGSVAFVHLYLNLKDIEAQKGVSIPRITSEVIPALARIRTDLDQFSPVERESLMYHGYTLIDAILQKNCPKLLTSPAPMRVAPLFKQEKMTPAARAVIRKDLEAGRQSVFLLRTLAKYPRLVAPTYLIGFLAWIVGAILLLAWKMPMTFISDRISGALNSMIPDSLENIVTLLLNQLGLPELSAIVLGISAIVSFLVVIVLPLYFVLFWVFGMTRQIAKRRDLLEYNGVAGSDPTVKWDFDKPEPETLKVKAAGA